MPRISLALCLLALAAVSGRAVAVDLYGGGADSPAAAYVGDRYLATQPVARLSRDRSIVVPYEFFSIAELGNVQPGRTPVFADFRNRYPADAVSYCRTGSGFGKHVFNGQGPYAADGDCAPNAATGFSALSARPDFIGNDAPYSLADYDAFLLNLQAERGAVVQIPVLAQAVAIVYRDGNGLPPGLNFTTETVCQVFGGNIRDWSDPRLGLNLSPPRPITVVYPSAGSGAGFALSGFLQNNCNGRFDLPAAQFRQSADFVVAVGDALQRYSAASPQPGEAAAVATVRQTAGALSYAGIGEALNQGAMYARVNSFDPATLATPNIAPANVLVGKVLNNGTIGDAPGTLSNAQRNCMRLIAPTAPISSAYPIVGVSYLNAYYAGNADKAPALRNLLRQFLRPIQSNPVDPRVALPSGYAYLDGNALYRGMLNAAINSCIN
ncbi:PstS family phosphate ABC transporter substrate-binding protein [Lysobacter enzymogenes]|uniref:PstS family phosphate ABC transporter substrate-binding protein n=1 Tax=Lysobacter enzymogenes TaxID=69 RepID=UPI00089A4CB4|nr:substrate-binding domain-containing protein [Lysobacter enzymogenes]SDX76129.1 ABC-type phosphate transport system, substrate-binding protein [Lysobacter enzymogenes]